LSQNSITATVNLGFLTIVQEANSSAGGYLVTNSWGRPLEFRLSTAVQPSRVHQILYGSTLWSYVCADLIGKTLLDKAAVPVRMVFTDHDAVLDLRLRVEIPVAHLVPAEGSFEEGADPRSERSERALLRYHLSFPGDERTVRDLLSGLDPAFDLREPFVRIREAMSEARRMGITNRAA